MGYNVEYDITLYVDDQDLKKTLYYDRDEDVLSDKDDHPLLIPPSVCSLYDWCITIADGTVDMEFFSEKFYNRYMTSMLKVLKERVPSLHGYVSCRDADVDIYWTITNKVRRYEREERALTAEARQMYEPSYCSWKSTQEEQKKKKKKSNEEEEQEEQKKKKPPPPERRGAKPKFDVGERVLALHAGTGENRWRPAQVVGNRFISTRGYTIKYFTDDMRLEHNTHEVPLAHLKKLPKEAERGEGAYDKLCDILLKVNSPTQPSPLPAKKKGEEEEQEEQEEQKKKKKKKKIRMWQNAMEEETYAKFSTMVEDAIEKKYAKPFW